MLVNENAKLLLRIGSWYVTKPTQSAENLYHLRIAHQHMGGFHCSLSIRVARSDGRLLAKRAFSPPFSSLHPQKQNILEYPLTHAELSDDQHLKL